MLKIVINTPYHLVGENKDLFEETGYVLERDGLPEEFIFSLSESVNPKLPLRLFADINDMIFIAMGVGVGLMIAIPIFILYRVRRKMKNE